MCIISKERIAFCAQGEGTRGEMFAASPIALQSRTISKVRIAICAQVERTRGEIFAASPIALQSRIISKERIGFWAQVEGTRGEIFAGSPIALQSQCKIAPNEPIPTYSHRWPQCQSVRLKYEKDRARRNGETAIGGRNATRRVVLRPGAE